MIYDLQSYSFWEKLDALASTAPTNSPLSDSLWVPFALLSVYREINVFRETPEWISLDHLIDCTKKAKPQLCKFSSKVFNAWVHELEKLETFETQYKDVRSDTIRGLGPLYVRKKHVRIVEEQTPILPVCPETRLGH